MITKIVFKEPIPIAFNNERLQQFTYPEWTVYLTARVDAARSGEVTLVNASTQQSFVHWGTAFSYIEKSDDLMGVYEVKQEAKQDTKPEVPQAKRGKR